MRYLIVLLALAGCAKDQPAVCEFVCYEERCHMYCEVPEVMAECDSCKYKITESGATFECTQCDTGTY